MFFAFNELDNHIDTKLCYLHNMEKLGNFQEVSTEKIDKVNLITRMVDVKIEKRQCWE